MVAFVRVSPWALRCLAVVCVLTFTILAAAEDFNFYVPTLLNQVPDGVVQMTAKSAVRGPANSPYLLYSANLHEVKNGKERGVLATKCLMQFGPPPLLPEGLPRPKNTVMLACSLVKKSKKSQDPQPPSDGGVSIYVPPGVGYFEILIPDNPAPRGLNDNLRPIPVRPVLFTGICSVLTSDPSLFEGNCGIFSKNIPDSAPPDSAPPDSAPPDSEGDMALTLVTVAGKTTQWMHMKTSGVVVAGAHPKHPNVGVVFGAESDCYMQQFLHKPDAEDRFGRARFNPRRRFFYVYHVVPGFGKVPAFLLGIPVQTDPVSRLPPKTEQRIGEKKMYGPQDDTLKCRIEDHSKGGFELKCTFQGKTTPAAATLRIPKRAVAKRALRKAANVLTMGFVNNTKAQKVLLIPFEAVLYKTSAWMCPPGDLTNCEAARGKGEALPITVSDSDAPYTASLR